jgi:hypothetical protein
MTLMVAAQPSRRCEKRRYCDHPYIIESMKPKEIGRTSSVVELSAAELRMVGNALNEVCNGVWDLDHDGEFEARLGVGRDEARTLLAELQSLIERAQRLP